MQISQQDNGQTGLFFIKNDKGQQIAKMTYVYRDKNLIDINHTFVDPSLRGQGVAHKLFDAAIAFANDKQLKIIPTCSYAVTMFERLPEYQHLRY
ncbi:GNAT family N-acetyltransferase [Alkanindiges sp. WGS2144]|uniref:GNAT family N-acetyltransferase n=1 Tax=Alkanindiges sp. WGS2144 TaxID=3366808 RepID=UPI003752BE3F